MFKKIIKILAGIILLPLVAGFSLGFFWILKDILFGFEIHKGLAYGFLAYIPIHIFLHKPIMTYVFAHELTHALWALPFGGRLRDFRVGEKGGHAVITRSNLLVDLAPYFFPFFSYMILALFGIFILTGAGSKVFPYASFFMGFTISFHLLFTVHSLMKKQSDLAAGGVILSLVIIIILNLFFITLSLKILDPDEINFIRFLKDSVYFAFYLVNCLFQYAKSY